MDGKEFGHEQDEQSRMSIRESLGTPYTPEDFGDLPGVSPAEATVLKLLRQKDLDKLTVVLRKGKILRVEAECDIAREDLSDRGGMMRLRWESDFETVTVTRHQGKVVKARRMRPFPFTEKENKRMPYGTSLCLKPFLRFANPHWAYIDCEEVAGMSGG